MTKTGGAVVGARLTVAEGVDLPTAGVGETTREWRYNDGGTRELPPETWEERTEERLCDERLEGDLLRRERDGERERLDDRERDERDDRDER